MTNACTSKQLAARWICWTAKWSWQACVAMVTSWRTANPRPTRCCSTLAAFGNMPRQDLQRTWASSGRWSQSHPEKVSAWWAAWRRKTNNWSLNERPTSTSSSDRASCNKSRCWFECSRRIWTTSGSWAGSQRGFAGWDQTQPRNVWPAPRPTMRPTPFQAYLRIQIGCDKFCTYCIVPSTRGPEQGRPPEQIVSRLALWRIKVLRDYTARPDGKQLRYRENGKTTRLADLLSMLQEIDGIERLKS